MTITSNPGHLLWSGIVPRERAAAVVRRLMADDMWSGWGIRTLSSNHPAYNPHDYQLGSVWPHDNGIIALGFAQYGFRDEAARVARGLIDAGNRFFLNRLPEVFAGTSRTETPFPVQYLGANVLQAWAAGSVFHLMQALVGLSLDVAQATLYADPCLPDWLPEIRVFDITMVDRSGDLRIWRDGAKTRIAITRGDHVTIVNRPFALHKGVGAPPD